VTPAPAVSASSATSSPVSSASTCLFPAAPLAWYRDHMFGAFIADIAVPEGDVDRAGLEIKLARAARELGEEHNRGSNCYCWHVEKIDVETSTAETGKWVLAGRPCVFPGKELRAYRRSLVDQVSKLEALDPSGESIHDQLKQIGRQIRAIDKLRLDHEELDGCKCWYSPEDLRRHAALQVEIRNFSLRKKLRKHHSQQRSA
jgi:hypothetical protein